MCRCPSCGSVFTLYFDGSENVWCSNCNNFCTIRIYEPDVVETEDIEEENTALVDIEFAGIKSSK